MSRSDSLDHATMLVRSLTGMDLQQLRAEWRRLYGAPPKLRSVDLLARLLAWRIQADASEGLDRAVKAALKRKTSGARGAALAPGTTVAREWRGVRQEAEVMEDGAVRYRGERYASLSEVARIITGSRWSGPKFFGLRSPPA